MHQQVDAYGADVHTFAYGLLLASVHMAEGLYAVAYLELGAEVEEHDLPLPSLLPLQLYGDAEEEMAQAAAAIVRCISLRASSGLEDAGTVLLEQGIIAIDAERTVAPADSRIEAPMRILLEVMISAKQIEKITPQLKQRRNQKEINTLVNTAVQSALLNKDSIENILKNLQKSLEQIEQ